MSTIGPDPLVTRVREHTVTAMWNLRKALDLLDEPEPGLMTWMQMLGECLEQAKAEIQKAQRRS